MLYHNQNLEIILTFKKPNIADLNKTPQNSVGWFGSLVSLSLSNKFTNRPTRRIGPHAVWLREVIGDIQTKWIQIRHDNRIFIGSKQMVYRISKKSKIFKKKIERNKNTLIK